MGDKQMPSKRSFSIIVIVAIVIASLFTGGLIGYLAGYYPNSGKILSLEEQLSAVEVQLSSLQAQISTLQTEMQVLDNLSYQNLTAATRNIQNQLSTIQTKISELQAKPDTASQNITILQSEISSLQSQLSATQQQVNGLQEAISRLQETPTITYQNITYVTGEQVSLSQLFEQVKSSVVVIQGLLRQTDLFGRVYYSKIQGSGFIYNHTGRIVVLTNNHVITGAINITVTFTTGAVYSATVLGTNSGTDFAVLTTNAPQSVYKPLEIVSSSTLKVGDPVIVVGTPYGLAGSMSNGIVSALNRTLTTTSNQNTISNVIQTTAPLNPGNSGGPVMNYRGQVVGIATAIVEESQGIGFAVPSDSILADIQRILT